MNRGAKRVVRGEIKGVNIVRKVLADGSLRKYYYHRITGYRLRGEPGSSEFIADYAAAEKSFKDRLAGTLNGLIRDYGLSVEFGKLAESTQREYRRMLTKAEVEFGDMPTAALEDPRVRQDFMTWRAEVAKQSGEREADNRLSVISAMLSWGKENGKVFSNHVAGFRRLHKADRSEKIWMPEQVDAFMKAAPVDMQRALIFALHTGQRQGDLLRLTWSNFDGTHLVLRQGKTGRKVEVPCTRALKRMLDGMTRDTVTILSTSTKKPWKSRYFKAQWAEASAKVGITDLHFHDLRGTAVTMLSEAGCTTPQIAAITGHSLKTVTQILDKYLARTRALADGAIDLLERSKTAKFANRLQTSTEAQKKGQAKSLK